MSKIIIMYLMVALSLILIGCDHVVPKDPIKSQNISLNDADKLSSDKYAGGDFRGKDVSSIDFKNDDLMEATFDDKTKWPEKLPVGFNPSKVLEFNKNPGLNIKYLHSIGITGKGVNVAVIDDKLLTKHIEFGNRIKMYEELGGTSPVFTMHASAVTSILGGKTTGVASEAGIYYIASGINALNLNFTWRAQAIEKIIQINRMLPIDQKIRVLSISSGCMPNYTGYVEFMSAIKKATSEGIFVVSGNFFETYNKFFYYGLDINNMADKDKTSSYVVTPWEKWINKVNFLPGFSDYYKSIIDKNPKNEMLLVPLDSKTTASQIGEEDYVYYKTGGWSELIPYLAGIYTLTCQVKPNITPDIFWSLALKTGDKRMINIDGKQYVGKIVNPIKLIKTLKSMN